MTGHYKIYTYSDHHLSPDKVDPNALYVIEKLKQAGHQAFLVGGGVRDLLFCHTPKDFDVATSAKPEEIRKIFRSCILIGRRFRLAHIRFGTTIIETSTFRAGDTENEALILRDNTWGTPEEDVKRRDFTINGLFYDPDKEEIIDYVNGFPDIEEKILRTIGQPFLRFKQDPVRMIRLLKFEARFNLKVEQETRLALLDCRNEIVKSSQARVLEELLRMLESGKAKDFFQLMHSYGLLQTLFPLITEFLEEEGKEESTLSLLGAVDAYLDKNLYPEVDRAILLSAFVFPWMHTLLEKTYGEEKHPPHLGEIYQHVFSSIEKLFRPFFLLPRKLRYGLAGIITSQYRLLPMQKKKNSLLKIPHDPEFNKALAFLEIRALVRPSIHSIWRKWHKALEEKTRKSIAPSKKNSKKIPKKRTSP